VLPVEQIINEKLNSSMIVIECCCCCCLHKNWWLQEKQAEVHVFKMLVHFVHNSTGLKYNEMQITELDCGELCL